MLPPTRLLLSALLPLAACAAPPPVSTEPPVATPDAWRAVTGAGEGTIDGPWWHRFADPALDAVVDAALRHNLDVRAAAARVEQAAALARVAGADLHPAVTAGLDGGRQHRVFVGFPFAGGSGPSTSTFTSYGLTLNIGWELDLWGRLRSRQGAALADLQATEAELHAAYLSLAAQTVKAWFALTEARLQSVLGQETVDSVARTQKEVGDRVGTGLAPRVDLHLATADLAAARALLAERREAEARQVRQLEILLGEYPAGARAPGAALPALPGPVPTGLPSALVRRRPDLVAAERRLAAAGARTDAAEADRFPRLSLTASGGSSTEDLSDLLDGDFKVWSIGANLLQPIFQADRLVAQADAARAAAAEARTAYARTVLQAFREVEVALAVEAPLQRREAELQVAVEASRAALARAQDRYQQGIDGLLVVLESQRRLLDNQSRHLRVQRQRLDNRVDLHLALGGGFELPPAKDPAER